MSHFKFSSLRRLVTSRRAVPYIFLAPFIVFFLLFRTGPIFFSLYASFTRWDGMGNMSWVGLQNYIDLFGDARFWIATKNTLFFVVVYNAIMISLAIVLAVLFDSVTPRWGRAFRAVYFVPITMSLPVVALVFDLIFARDFGLLNLVLGKLGLPNDLRWLRDANLAMWAIVIMRVWRGAGYYSAYIVAGLKSLPQEIYDAAEVDGASGLQMLFRITLPMLKPLLLFVLIMSSILSFQLFDEPWILTGGGPADATLTLQILLYQSSFLFNKFGLGSAISYLMTLMMMGASILYVKLLSEKNA